MKDPRINFRTRELAAILAFLVPGAGHFYQGRRWKAGVYFTCILSLFFAGMVLGDWQPVYSQVVYSTQQNPVEMNGRQRDVGSTYSIGYAAQILVGLPALPALLQQGRFSSDDSGGNGIQTELNSDFSGMLHTQNSGPLVPLTGHLKLSPGKGKFDVAGTFEGKTRDGKAVTGEINGSVSLGRDVYGSPRRRIYVRGFSGDAAGIESGELDGTVSRSFLNWYQAPRDNGELDRLHGKLSQYFDIACVFTWIAGLLNLMAIWDAYDGPAYGYGDEEPEEDDDDDANSGGKAKASKD